MVANVKIFYFYPPSLPLQNQKSSILFLCPCFVLFCYSAMEQRIASGRRDLFRTRKQNTSRPPSMHVDDFMAKVGYNISKFLSKYLNTCDFYPESWREGGESWFSHARGPCPLHASARGTIYAPHGWPWLDGWPYAPSWAWLPPRRDGGNETMGFSSPSLVPLHRHEAPSNEVRSCDLVLRKIIL